VLLKLEILKLYNTKSINQIISAKISNQKGNSPNYKLKFINIVKYKNLLV